MNTPSIYVGTYAKYNDGSLFGEWVDVDDFSTIEDFYEYCAKLHKDEDDPEFMFQDWEYIPDKFIGESHLSSEFFDYLNTVSESGLDADVFEAAMDIDIEPEEVEERYRGQFRSDADFAEDWHDQTASSDESVERWPYYYIDWERAAVELMQGFTESDGHYFDTSY